MAGCFEWTLAQLIGDDLTLGSADLAPVSTLFFPYEHAHGAMAAAFVVGPGLAHGAGTAETMALTNDTARVAVCVLAQFRTPTPPHQGFFFGPVESTRHGILLI